jgi:hypothetical protein
VISQPADYIQPYRESRAQRAPCPPRPLGEGRGEGNGHGEQRLSWSGVALVAMAVTMKAARSDRAAGSGQDDQRDGQVGGRCRWPPSHPPSHRHRSRRGPAPRERVVALVVGSLQPIAHAVGAAGSTLSGARRVTAVAERLHIELGALDQNTLSSSFPSTFGKKRTPTHRAIRGRPAPGRRHCSDHVGVAVGVDRR